MLVLGMVLMSEESIVGMGMGQKDGKCDDGMETVGVGFGKVGGR